MGDDPGGGGSGGGGGGSPARRRRGRRRPRAGVAGLRVADASVFPIIPNGNLNAPTIMTAEKISDAILGRTLPPDDEAAAAVWIDPEWRGRRRERRRSGNVGWRLLSETALRRVHTCVQYM